MISTVDLAWAAGIWEGEGSIGDPRTKGRYLRGLNISVCQQDPWILHKLQALFGGPSVRTRPASTHNPLSAKDIWVWQITGPRAYGTIMTLYPLLSPHRQEQVRKHIYRYMANRGNGFPHMDSGEGKDA